MDGPSAMSASAWMMSTPKGSALVSLVQGSVDATKSTADEGPTRKQDDNSRGHE